jgi:hypothetical protein
MKNNFHFLLMILWMCASCAPGVSTVAPTVSVAGSAISTPSPAPSPTDLPSPTPTPSAPKRETIAYSLDVNMDYDAKTLAVRQQTTFANNTAIAIPAIVFAVQPNRIPGVFTLQSLSADGVPISAYSLEGQRLQFTLPAPLLSGQTIVVDLEYSLSLPRIAQGDPNQIRPQIFGFTDRQVNLTDWYPMLVPFSPETGWQLADPWYYGEHLVYPLADFDVILRFTDPASLPQIAASAAAGPIESGFSYRLLRARTFSLAMGRQLQVISAEANGVTVNSYFYPGFETAGQAVLDATLQAVKTYAELFGPYPHTTLAAVQGDFNDGMEFDGLYYLSNAFYNLYDGTRQNYLVMVAAHETCHQWWFGAVASDQANHPWLDESIATYCERLFYEKNDPEALSWWWAYRIDYYQPDGKMDGTVPSYGGFTPYTNATYRQGARFYEELRQVIGDQAFFAFLKDYYAVMNGKIATPEAFFTILRAHTSADLSPLLAKYFQKAE